VTEKLHVRAGSTAEPPFELVVTPESAGWSYVGLRVLDLPPGGSVTWDTRDEELLVLPLSGGCTVTCAGTGGEERFDVQGRAGVFTRVSDFVYVPRDAQVTVASVTGGRFALPSTRCERRREPRYRAAEEVPVEFRGAGTCSRQIVNLCSPDWPYADKLIAVEVLTPGGNWSSYPPHKHDEAREGENVLEEIYYFRIHPGASGEERRGFAFHRVYGTADRPLDVLAEVHAGDVVLIPYGYHGPSMAAPGYDLYYLNVMAGPGARAWLPCDDPAHAWVRGTWDGQSLDPRLPLTSAVEGSRS
jgi:5-deoxy-glucuronate isomerase